MASRPTEMHESDAGRIAAWSAGIGFFAALVVAGVTDRLMLDRQRGDATTLGALGFSVAWAAPFIAALASFLMVDPAVRRAVWLGSGMLSLGLAGLTVFSGVWLLFGPAGVGLIVAWWLTRGRTGLLGPARAIAMTGWLLLCLGGALWLLGLRDTPACWQESGWVAASSSQCARDILDDTEGLLALVATAAGLAGAAVLGRASVWASTPWSRNR